MTDNCVTIIRHFLLGQHDKSRNKKACGGHRRFKNI